MSVYSIIEIQMTKAFSESAFSIFFYLLLFIRQIFKCIYIILLKEKQIERDTEMKKK